MCERPLLPTSYADCHRLLKHVKGGWEAADGSGASTSSGLNVRIASGTSSGNETSCDGGWPLPSKMHGAARLLGLLGSGLVCVVRDPRKRGETLHFLFGHEETQSLIWWRARATSWVRSCTSRAIKAAGASIITTDPP